MPTGFFNGAVNVDDAATSRANLGISIPITVANGGTGNVSQPAFSLVAGGTTTTGSFQSVGPVAVGQVLASGGTGSLPNFTSTPSVTSITLGSGTALNTYVQGTWLPNLAFGGASIGITYSIQSGFYTQIGNIVFFSYTINLTSKGSSTGNAAFSNLPVTAAGTAQSANMSAVGGYLNFTFTALYTLLAHRPGNNSTNLFFFQSASSTGSFFQATDANFANNTVLQGQGFYFV